MSFVQHIKAFVQQPSTPVETDGVNPAPTARESPSTQMGEKISMAISNHADDTESQKPVFQATELGEEGAQRIELMQEVWGKHGKLYIFLAYELGQPFITIT